MPDEIYYSRAPIVEAILGIEVEGVTAPPERFAIELEGYPSSTAIKQGEFKFDIADSTAQANVKDIGRKYTSADGKQVVQMKADGFAYSRLAPYDGWLAFITEAERLWRIYKSLLEGPWKHKNLIVRYINRLVLPLGPDIDAYFNVYAYFPPDYPVRGRNYLLRVELLIDDPAPGILTMQHASLSEQHPDAFAFLVDHEFKFSLNETTPLWPLIQEVRAVKNQTFQRVLTEHTKELIR